MKRFEKIQSMNIDQLAEFVNDLGNCATCSRQDMEDCRDIDSCLPYVKEWLESEVEE